MLGDFYAERERPVAAPVLVNERIRRESTVRTMQFKLPDELVRELDDLGLLGDERFQELLEDATREERARRNAGRELLELVKLLDEFGIPPMTDDEIVAEVNLARDEWRAQGA